LDRRYSRATSSGDTEEGIRGFTEESQSFSGRNPKKGNESRGTLYFKLCVRNTEKTQEEKIAEGLGPEVTLPKQIYENEGRTRGHRTAGGLGETTPSD